MQDNYRSCYFPTLYLLFDILYSLAFDLSFYLLTKFYYLYLY